LFHDNAAYWNRGCGLQCYSQQTSGCDETVFPVFTKEFEYRQILRVFLYFIEKNKCVVIDIKLLSGNRSQSQIKILFPDFTPIIIMATSRIFT